MFNFFRKHKFLLDVLFLIFFGLSSIIYFIEYPKADNKKFKLVSAIVLSIMTVAKLGDVIENFQNKKNEKVE